MELGGLIVGALALVDPALNRLTRLAERVEYSRSLRNDIVGHLSACTRVQSTLNGVSKIVQSQDVQLPAAVESAVRQRLSAMSASLGIVEGNLEVLEVMISDMSSAGTVKKSLHTAYKFWKSRKVHETLEGLGEELEKVSTSCDNVVNAFIARSPTAVPTSGSSVADDFKPSFSVLPNTKALAFNFDLSNTDGTPLTCEAQLKAALDSNETAVGAVAVGNGGEGKTCALRELANMRDVQAKYTGGVYFLVLGSDATVKTVIERLKIEVLRSGGSAAAKDLETVTDLEEAVAIAATWFRSHTCLFVVDDIWPVNEIPENVVEVLSKLCDGSIDHDRSKMLFSTRNKDVASYGQAIEFNARDRTPAESQKKLLTAAGANVSVLEDPEVLEAVQKILSACQGLSLMLNIAGSTVMKMSAMRNRPSCPWMAYADKLSTEVGMELERKVRGEISVGPSIQTSLDFLDEHYAGDLQGSTCSSYKGVVESLCVLQKQDLVPFNILSRLWSVASHDVSTVAGRLESVSLVEISQQLTPSGESLISSVQIHDLIHDYAELQVRKNDRVCVWPEHIVQSFEQELSEQSGGDCWPSLLPHDGYILSNICRLLLMSGRTSFAGSVLGSIRWTKRMLQLRDILQLEKDAAAFCKLQFAPKAQRDAVEMMARIARLSLPFCMESDQAICFQLYGRLLAIDPDTTNHSWVEDAMGEVLRNSEKPWLRPVNACLSSPDSPTIAIYRTHFHLFPDGSTYIKYFDGGRFVYCGCHERSLFVSTGELSGKVSNNRFDVTQELDPGEVMTCVALNAEASQIVTGSSNGAVRIWNSSTGQGVMPSSHRHTGFVRSVGMSADGARVVIALDDMTVRVWDVKNRREVCAPLTGHTEWVRSVAMSADGERVVSGSDDKTVRVWNVEFCREVCGPLTGHKEWVRSVAISADGARVASGSDDKTLRVWDVECGREVCAPLIGHNDWVQSVAMSADGTRVVSGSHDKTVRVWNVERGTEVCAPLTGHANWVQSVAISADGELVVSGSDDNTVRVWDVVRSRGACNPHIGHRDYVRSVAMSADGARVVSGSNDKTVRVWDVESGREICAPLTGHCERVWSVAMSVYGGRVASGSDDRTVRVWDVERGREVCAPLTGHDASVRCVAISANGTRVVSGSYDKTVRVWEVDRGLEVCAPLIGHKDWVQSVAMSTDGARVVSGSYDNTVRVWDVGLGHEVCAPLAGHAAVVSRVAISADGRRVASASKDNTVRVWDVDRGMCTREEACRRSELGDIFRQFCDEELGEGGHGGAYGEAVFKTGGDGRAWIVRSVGASSTVMAHLEQGIDELLVSAQMRTVVVVSDMHVAFFKIEE